MITLFLLYGIHMALRDWVRIKQSKNAHTQYLIIPSAIVRDSQYPFKKEEEVEITVEPSERKIIVKSLSKTKEANKVKRRMWYGKNKR
jgi:hypothetical protein